MKKVRKKAHSQTTILPARADDGPWRWIVDNRMRDYGETNFEREWFASTGICIAGMESFLSIRSSMRSCIACFPI